MSLSPPPAREKLPIVNGWAEMPSSWIRWFTELANQAVAAANAAVSWDSVSKTGSNLTDLETRFHGDLQEIDTADHAHLYLADRDQLVAGDDTVLHYHDSDRDSDNFFGAEWVDLTDAGETLLHAHKWPTVADVIDIGETVTINVNRQLIVAENLTNSGTIINNGKLYII